jgi:hypothetical protein
MQWRNLSHRPKGITFMSILQIIGAIVLLIVPLMIIIPMILIFIYTGVNPLIMPFMMSSFLFSEQTPSMMPNWLMILPMIMPFIYLPLGIFFAIVGYGLYVGKGWAWKYTVTLQVINFVFSISFSLLLPLLIVSLSPMPLAMGSDEDSLIGNLMLNSIVSLIPTVIFFIITMSYMLRPKTRAYFGKVQIDIK